MTLSTRPKASESGRPVGAPVLSSPRRSFFHFRWGVGALALLLPLSLLAIFGFLLAYAWPVLRVLLPVARAQIITGILLALAIALGETAPSSRDANGKAVCDAQSTNIGGEEHKDYIPHHAPFQYYSQTANPHHLPPSSVAMIGQTDQANHNYDLSDFWDAVRSQNMPAVSFLKPKAIEDAHPGYSDPIDEQHFIVETLNRLQKTSYWRNTAVIIAYDDSDGWYDHVMPPIVRQSSIEGVDAGYCGTGTDETQGRCGFGPRLPLLVISPSVRAPISTRLALSRRQLVTAPVFRECAAKPTLLRAAL